MASIYLNRSKLRHNFQYLDGLFKDEGIEWAIVTKLLCGNKVFLREVLDLGIKEVCDSRISNLQAVKEIDPNVQTVYIKPPPAGIVEEIVRYADVTFNSESETIRMLSEEAQRQGKMHKITIMIELGDLREGIMGDHLIEFYRKIFELPNIEITAIGTNLTCLHGVMPSHDKLVQLSLYKQLIEAKFDKTIPWVTAGTSVALPLLFRKQVPSAINHFRVGETLFFGNNLVDETLIEHMETGVFKLEAEILEITEKPVVPFGQLGSNVSGDVFEVDENDYGRKSYRAIIDIGLLDILPDTLFPEDPDLKVVNASSDMLIIDLKNKWKEYKVGDSIMFDLNYMGVLRLLSSDYIEKKVIE